MAGFTLEEIKQKAMKEQDLSSYECEKILWGFRNTLRTQQVRAKDFKLSTELAALSFASWAKRNNIPVYHTHGTHVTVALTFNSLYDHEKYR